MNKDLIQYINNVQHLARTTKLKRFLFAPKRYLIAIFFKKIIYPLHHTEKKVSATLFNKYPITIALPAATDIYLTGGKTHNSEIRLAKFLIHTIKIGNAVLDVGAHYGYFSILAAELVGNTGKVFSFEPSPKTFQLLAHNCASIPVITIHNLAISDSSNTHIFFEFSNQFSEYNTFDITQFETQKWFKQAHPKALSVDAITINELFFKSDFNPHIIKIDVEGAENLVITGGIEFFKTNSPIVVLEYVNNERNNQNHKAAALQLMDLNYKPFAIGSEGELFLLQDINQYLNDKELESDNIVFKRKD